MKNLFSRPSGRLFLLGFASLLAGFTAGPAIASPADYLLSPLAIPTVNSFSPTSGAVGATVNISGTGFTGVTSVTFNNTPATFVVNSSSRITATVPAGASSGRIRVINADGTGRSNTSFTVVQPPVISSFSPATARVGATVTVNGARLNGAIEVQLNGTPVAFTQVSNTRVTFVVPAGATSGFISVVTPNGTATSATQFVVRPDQPTITSFSPTSGAPGVTVVTITGTNFLNATEVRFGTTTAPSYTVVSATSITVTVPAGATSGRLRIVTAGGTGVSATSFTIVGAPTITSFTPATSAVGGTITIRGTGFVNVSSVQFNGVSAATFTVNSRQRITATVPAGATTGAISVTTPSGTATSATNLTITANAPTITSFNPGSGDAAVGATPGTSVQINGSGFFAGTITSVSFNGVNQPVFTRNNNGRITVRVPAGATTGKIAVTTTNGTAFSANNFIVNNTETDPTISPIATQRQCASAGTLTVTYTVDDAQTPADELTVTGTSPGAGTVITFTADNSGAGTTRTATIDVLDPAVGGTTSLTLTATDGAGRTASTTFSVTFDPVVTADAGADQIVLASQPVAVSGTAVGATTTQWTTSGSGSFDNPAAAATNYNPSQADYLNGAVTLTFTASGAAGATCPNASDAAVVTFVRADVIVTGVETLSGAYGNVLVTGTGVLTVGAGLDVASSLVVLSGGTLRGGPACAPVTGSGSFTLEDGAQLDVCHPQGIAFSGASGQIQLTGGRSFGAGAGYAYVGSGAQSTGSGLPLNLTGAVTVDNGGGGVNLTSSLNLRGVLRLATGDLRLTESANLTVISNADGTGVVINQGGVVDGQATVQRYIEASLSTARGFHHLSSPVTSAPVSDLLTAGFGPVVNPAFNTAPNPRTVRPYPNVFAYDETRFPASSDFSLGYFSPAAPNSPLESGRGYSVFINGGLKPDFVGTLTTGDVTRTGLTRTGTATGPGEKSGWHLLGNPYPSPIDWDLVTVPAGMSNAVFVWRSTGGNSGSYESYVNGSGTPGTDLIGLGQGIFVRVTSATPVNFTFTNACRVADSDVPVFRTAAARPQLALTLRATAAPTAEATEAYVYFQENATAGYDPAFDGARPGRNVGVPTLATVVGNEELAVNALAPDALTGARLPLLVDVPAAGTYELAVRELTSLTGTDVYLLDALTGTTQALTATSRYVFTAATAGEQATRFALRFGKGAAVATVADALSVWPNPATGRAQVRLIAPVTGRLTLVDGLGRTVRTQALSAGQTDATLDLAGLPAGVYTVRAAGATTRLVVE